MLVLPTAGGVVMAKAVAGAQISRCSAIVKASLLIIGLGSPATMDLSINTTR